MASTQWKAQDYLKARDPSTLPRRPGREASTFYPSLVQAFLEADEAAMEVDVAKIGRKPDTVRSALTKAIKTLALQDKVRVSMLRGEVILLRR